MNVSKSVFVVLLMSIVSMLLLSSVATAAAPKVSFVSLPSNVIAGTTFKVSVSASNDTAVVQPPQFINTITLASDLNWPVSPQSVNCNSQLVCLADFTVTVPSAAAVGQAAKFTAQVATNTDAGSATATTVVSGAPSAGNKVPISVDGVLIDNFELSSSDTNIRDMERGQSFALKVKLTANSDANDVEIRSFVTGFEFGRNDPISDSAGPFDVQKGVSYVKTLSM